MPYFCFTCAAATQTHGAVRWVGTKNVTVCIPTYKHSSWVRRPPEQWFVCKRDCKHCAMFCAAHLSVRERHAQRAHLRSNATHRNTRSINSTVPRSSDGGRSRWWASLPSPAHTQPPDARHVCSLSRASSTVWVRRTSAVPMPMPGSLK